MPVPMPGPTGPRRADRRWRVIVPAALAGSVVLAGCSGGTPAPGPDPTSQGSEAAGPGAAPVATTVRMGRVTGRLPTAGKREVKQQVGRVVDRWFDAAYVGGDYPRGDFSTAFDAFTAGAARRARADRGLMSNAVVGPRTTAVEAVRREVRVDALGVAGRPAAATARFVLVTDRTRRDAVVRRERVAGRLLLTRGGGGRWRVFAYDVSQGSRAADGGER